MKKKMYKISKILIKIITIRKKKELKKLEKQNYPKIFKSLSKALKEIQKDGYQNGKEKDIKRKEEKVQEKPKD